MDSPEISDEDRLKQSLIETQQHIELVRDLLGVAIENLIVRGQYHDASKLQEPEASAFAKAVALKGLTYDSPEYHQARLELGEALKHHYEHNKHHPEHYANGIDGMDLFDVVEMFVDWRAATQRHADGDMETSIRKNQTRFQMSDQLVNIFLNTVKYYPKA